MNAPFPGVYTEHPVPSVIFQLLYLDTSFELIGGNRSRIVIPSEPPIRFFSESKRWFQRGASSAAFRAGRGAAAITLWQLRHLMAVFSQSATKTLRGGVWKMVEAHISEFCR